MHFSISTGSILVSKIQYPETIAAVALIPTVPAIPNIPVIQNTANTVCCNSVQLRERSSNRKRISTKRTWRKRQGSFWLQFYTIMRLVSECGSEFLEWEQ
ncbi:MAG: hypothetical protein EZS28_045616 [Streblomastix strix]|uniref:Uncharacterized protein n=1 Tax=Streblomastix strix TaxID=222440 RepID=A0A5J4TKW1_9EUKA|nr:MAG: hypothetical protein EZS28_045616 [Streblomastix strix]